MWRLLTTSTGGFGMRRLIGVTVLSAIALSLPQVAQAQRRAASAGMGGAEHELGVDVGLAYVKPQNVSGGIVIQTPVVINTVGGTTRYLLTPALHVLFSNSPGGHRRGMYLTGGAGLVLGDNGTGSGTAIQLGAGVGWRKPYGSGAWRYEVGFQWQSDNANLGPSTIAIGGSIGISLWH